jgi:hypothetical protein
VEKAAPLWQAAQAQARHRLLQFTVTRLGQIGGDLIVSASSRILKAKATDPMAYLTETSVPKLKGPY